MAEANVHITKLGAAERLLRAAIRMYFAGEESLAVQVVASAAYRVLADLKRLRGQDEAADFYLVSMFYLVRDYRRGTLPKKFTEDSEAMRVIKALAEQLPIAADSTIENIRLSVSEETARTWWGTRNRVYNFLKHADRDPKDSIVLADVDNFQLLMQAVNAYNDLVPRPLRPEGLVLWIYSNVEDGTVEQLPSEYQSMAQEMFILPHNEKLSFCSKILRMMS